MVPVSTPLIAPAAAPACCLVPEIAACSAPTATAPARPGESRRPLPEKGDAAHYSPRSAEFGSARVARTAGTVLAPNATASSSSPTAP